MKDVYVLQTDDKNFKESIDKFLSKYCRENNVNVAIYEMKKDGANEVMQVVKQK